MRLFRAVIVTSGAAMAIGFGVALWGRSMPIYLVDFDRARAAFYAWCPPKGGVDSAAGERYLALFSWHYALINIGIALILGGLTTAALAFGLHGDRPTETEGSWLRSPRYRWTWLAIGLGAFAQLHAANISSFATDLYRQMFPPCADTIFMPISGLNALAAVIAPILVVIGALIILGFGTLPAPLYLLASTRAALLMPKIERAATAKQL